MNSFTCFLLCITRLLALDYSGLLRGIGREIAAKQRLYKGENLLLQVSLHLLPAPGLLPSISSRSSPMALLAPLDAPATPLAEANESESASATAGEQLGGRHSRRDGDHLMLWKSAFVVASAAGEQQLVASAGASADAVQHRMNDALERDPETAQPPSKTLVKMVRVKVRQLEREN